MCNVEPLITLATYVRYVELKKNYLLEKRKKNNKKPEFAREKKLSRENKTMFFSYVRKFKNNIAR